MSLYLGCIADDFTGATRRARGVTTDAARADGDARPFAIQSGGVRRKLGQYQCAIRRRFVGDGEAVFIAKGLGRAVVE